MPSPLGKLVDATHPDAKIPQRASNSVPSRKQTRLASLDGMPTDGGAVGLGLVALDNDENTFDDPVSKVMGNLERLSIKNEPKRKVLGERNLNALLPAQNVDAKAKPGKSMSLQDKSSKATTEKSHIPFSVLDENGKPMASKVPTKRYPSLPERKPRSSLLPTYESRIRPGTSAFPNFSETSLNMYQVDNIPHVIAVPLAYISSVEG
ncbi:hypothetical protein MOBT1_001261 [Malassezia obtusa]|uniref:Uncharacterized protein n=1 Tax=Malassezia obtusa TaxID=76774 RepID=A0AAF0DYM2_9BASI|nr:hypothetical protein MOBT1_001261 [Malassezia obtusa]